MYCYLSHVMRKPAYCKSQNKGEISCLVTAQVIIHPADQCLCFRYIDSTIPLLPKLKFQASRHLLWFVLDLVGNREGKFSPDAAHFFSLTLHLYLISAKCNNVTQYNCKAKHKNEPRCEKTGLQGFRPGRTQTGLYSHRRWLEA